MYRTIMLLGLFAQLVFSAQSQSPTIDEPNHLARGYAYLKTGDLRLSRVGAHPPLFNLLCALPLALLQDLSMPLNSPNWKSGYLNAFATELVFSGTVPLKRLFFLARLPVMLTTLCLAALIARWAGELYGPWGSRIALLLSVLDPNLIAHGQVVTTDIAVTFFFALSIYLFCRFLRRPSWILLLLNGLSLGLAQSVKFSAILLLPIFGLLGLIEVAYSDTQLAELLPGKATLTRWRALRSLLGLGESLTVVIVLAGVVIWAVYSFEVGTLPGWPIVLPAPYYVEGLLGTFSHASSIGHPAFLMGERSTLGWWYYFPVVFALKTPLIGLLALLAAWVSNAWRRLSRDEWALLLIPALYMALSTQSVLNIGYRHLLPMLPFLWVYAGRLGPAIIGTDMRIVRNWTMGAMGIAGLWLAVSTLRVAPDYLAYFNIFAGGPDGGWRYLVDSNLDWGQGMWSLKAYLAEIQPQRVYLSWFGSTYPHMYDAELDYQLLPSHFAYPYPRETARSAYNPNHPASGLYIISATNLQGVGLTEGDVFARFREQQPVARIGHSLFVYQVDQAAEDSGPTCIAEQSLRDLAPDTVQTSYGRGPGTVKWFTLESSFILPATGDPVYVLPGPPLAFVPAWQKGFLESARAVQQQPQGKYPAAIVYSLDQASANAWRQSLLDSIRSEPIHWSNATSFDASTRLVTLPAPVIFDHGISFLGYLVASGDMLRPGQTLELVTIWRTEGQMPAVIDDLQSFVHLLDRQSQVWTSQDRLDLYPPTWEAGDILIQYYRLALPQGMSVGTYQLELGLYTSLKMQRLNVWDGNKPVSNRLLLQPIQVTAP
jgi:hypothetical protein